jgi:large subunit ribosomal protein L4
MVTGYHGSNVVMIELPVYNTTGQKVETVTVDEALLGGIVRRKLLKYAVVMYQANRRLGTVATKSRGMVAGSTRKLYAQKHTGRARMGNIRTCVRRGGGVAFAKTPKDWSLDMPEKAKRLAKNSALLSKMKDGEFLIVDQLGIGGPKTRVISGILKALKIESSCLLGTGDYDKNVYLSVRNLSSVSVLPVNEFNAYDVLRHRKILVTKAGYEKIIAGSVKTVKS